MKSYGFIASSSGWSKGYVTAENEQEAKEKIMCGEYDDIIDSGGEEIDDVVELWECDD